MALYSINMYLRQPWPHRTIDSSTQICTDVHIAQDSARLSHARHIADTAYAHVSLAIMCVQ
jgi:hypothetical protein